MSQPVDRMPWWWPNIEFTPEEEAALDEVWTSPEMQEAIKAAAEQAKQDAQTEEDEADDSLSNLDLSNDWLYDWADLPTNLEDLRKWLKEHNVDVEEFKNSGRYEANYDRFPWLADL